MGYLRASVPAPRSHLAKLLIVVLVLVGLAAASACRGEKPAATADSRPHAIVLVTVDGLVPGRLALFGGADAAPELERLAAEGAAWADAWTAAPMTRAGAATYLTGLSPDRHGVRDDRFSSLDPSVPTLAEALAAAGYRTAAFPDSGFLGSSSGLLRGFEAASEPRPQPVGPTGWLPIARPVDEVLTDFDAWIGALPKDGRSFAWLHFSGPLLDQLGELAGRPVPERQPSESALAAIDAALGRVRRALVERGEEQTSLIVVAGTQGSIRGGEGGAAGLGYSVGESAVAVPIVARWPGAPGSWDRDRAAWSPDVAATIAAAAGVALAPGAEGLSLTEAAGHDRVSFAWALAPLDQMSWRAARAARSGASKWIEGQAAHATPAPAGAEERLVEALAQRPMPAPPLVPLDQVRSLLAEQGLKLDPAPTEGRDFGDAAKRLEVSELVLRAREAAVRGAGDDARVAYESALRLDPDNPAALLDLSQIVPGRRSRELLSHAVSRYPTQPEILHWYAHAVWTDSWRKAEPLLRAIEPHKASEADVLYDLACARSLGGELDASEEYLRRAIAAGFKDFAYMEADPDLRNLRESGKFSAVVREHR